MSTVYTIENNELVLKVSSVGAEMISLVSKKDGCEFLKGLGGDFWQRCAPLLFPINGRLWDGICTHKGKTYKMDTHGVAKLFDFELFEKSDASMTLRMESTPEMLENNYPFPFEILFTFALEGNKVINSVRIKNKGDEVMPYSVGLHPAFRRPFNDDESFDDYYVEFCEECKPNTWLLSPRYFVTGETAPFEVENGKVIPLYHEMFDGDAIFLQDIPGKAELRSRKSDRCISFDYTGFPFVGLWHTPMTKAPFVCFEPWTGSPDIDGQINEITTKKDMILLDPKAEAVHTLTFTVK